MSRFKVGGTDVVSSTSAWATSSNGASGASVPDTTQDVILDASSFSAGGQTLTIDADFACKAFAATAVTNSPTMPVGSSARTWTIAGDLAISTALAFTGNLNRMTMNSAGTQTIALGGRALPIVNRELKFTGGGTWGLSDNWPTMANLQMYLETATLNTNGRSLNVRQMYDAHTGGGTPGTVVVNCGASAVTIHDAIDLAMTGTTLAPQTSSWVWVPDVDFVSISVKSSVTFATVAIQQGVNTGHVVSFSGGFTVTYLTLEGGSGDYPMGGISVGAITSQGTGLAPVRITGAFAALNPISVDYCVFTNCTATGALVTAGPHCIDGGGNSGIAFTSGVTLAGALTMGVGV